MEPPNSIGNYLVPCLEEQSHILDEIMIRDFECALRGIRTTSIIGSATDMKLRMCSRVRYSAWVCRSILPKGPKVVPFEGSYLEFYKVIPKRNYFGAFG